MLGTGLLYQLPSPSPNFCECLGSQGVLIGSAGGEYQHMLEYIYALIKKTLHWQITNLPVNISMLHCSFSPFLIIAWYFLLWQNMGCLQMKTFLLEKGITLQMPVGDMIPELLWM